MEYLEILGFFGIMVVSNIICFKIGASVRQKVDNRQEVKVLPKSPIEAYKEKAEEQATQEEIDKLEAILKNIDNYDGTNNHQEDIPR